MIFISCTSTSCEFVARIQTPDETEADQLIGPSCDWYPDRYPCPVCDERCAISTKNMSTARVRDLTVHEAFVAFNKVGLPGEHECGATVVEKLLREQRIVDVSVRHISGTNRCTLDRLTLDNGVALYLASSVHGACVYRITKPESYVEPE